MYPNLEAELARKKISRKDVAAIIGCSTGTASLKMNGKATFTMPEAKAIRNFLKVKESIDYLFATETESSDSTVMQKVR